MSSAEPRRPSRTPLIALVHAANREFQADMVRVARAAGYDQAKPAHTAVFANLPATGARSADLAAKARITRQSMGEVIRELVDFGILEMTPDPDDRRAKRVTYTDAGLRYAGTGMTHIADFEDRMLAELGEEAYECLRDGLETIARVLAAEAESPD